MVEASLLVGDSAVGESLGEMLLLPCTLIASSTVVLVSVSAIRLQQLVAEALLLPRKVLYSFSTSFEHAQKHHVGT